MIIRSSMPYFAPESFLEMIRRIKDIVITIRKAMMEKNNSKLRSSFRSGTAATHIDLAAE